MMVKLLFVLMVPFVQTVLADSLRGSYLEAYEGRRVQLEELLLLSTGSQFCDKAILDQIQPPPDRTMTLWSGGMLFLKPDRISACPGLSANLIEIEATDLRLGIIRFRFTAAKGDGSPATQQSLAQAVCELQFSYDNALYAALAWENE
jgi:hypothetical protein